MAGSRGARGRGQVEQRNGAVPVLQGFVREFVQPLLSERALFGLARNGFGGIVGSADSNNKKLSFPLVGILAVDVVIEEHHGKKLTCPCVTACID